MADIVWPPALPANSTLVAFRKRLAKTAIRSSVDAGVAKVRRRYTAAPEMHDVAFKFTRTQVAVFRDFFDNVTQGGALSFEWTDQELDTPATFRFTGEPELRPLAPHGDGTEYWETETFTLEKVPPANSDTSGGDPPPSVFNGFYDGDESAGGRPEPASDEDGMLPVEMFGAAVPPGNYYPWLIEGEAQQSGSGSETLADDAVLLFEDTGRGFQQDGSEGAGEADVAR